MKERLRKLEALALTVVMCTSMMQTGVTAAEFGDGENVTVEQQEVFSDSSEDIFYDAETPDETDIAVSAGNVNEEDAENNSSNNNLSDEIPPAEDTIVNVSNAAVDNLVRSVGKNGKVDIAFLIDSTGSMRDEITGVRNNLNKFTEVLQNAGLDFRISVIDYKDITDDGDDSTKVLMQDGEKWFTTSEKVASVLDTISVNGGGDNPETVLDAIGLMNTLDFRDDASKFSILLTDAEYKNDNHYGYSDMSAAITALKEKGVSMSVITANSLQSTYATLSEGTDGIFANIYGDFAEELVKLASYVETVVNPVTFKLSTEVKDHPLTSGYMALTLTAEISASDKKNTAKNISVQLEIPEGITLDSGVQQTQIIESLAPGETKTLTWAATFPIPNEDTNYEWKVKADCDDFATGVVCQAQDSFSVAGKQESDYKFEFGKDNYSFLNSYSAFGNGKIYVDITDINALLADLDNTETLLLADQYAQGTDKVEELKKGNLEKWNGSCYGMALTAALFKTGILDSDKYGGTQGTNSIPAIESKSDSLLESMINIYHISQVFANGDVDKKGTDKLADIISTMESISKNIGKKDSRQMPYIVLMYKYKSLKDEKPKSGHAVVCYGVEYGDYSRWWFKKYNKRFLIADPNSSKEEYIYASSDNKDVYFSNGDYNSFGYITDSISELNKHSYEDAKENYIVRILAEGMTDYQIKQNRDKSFNVVNGKIEKNNGLEVENFYTVDQISDSEFENGSETGIIQVKNTGLGNSDFTIVPQNDDNIDATFYFKDYALSVKADADSAEFGKDGSIELNQAKGEVSLGVTLNNSKFDFVTVSGEADGTVNISKDGDSLVIKGDLADFEIENLDRDGNTTDFNVEGDKDVKADLEKDKKDLEVKYDPKGEGNYDTPLENVTHIHDYDVKFVWSGDNCTAQISCKKTSCEFNKENKEVPCNISYETVSGSTCISEGQGRETAEITYEGKTYSDFRYYSIPASGHSLVEVPAVPATCTETGLSEGEKCSVCGTVTKEQTVIPAKGHDWEEDYRVDKEASCGEDGSKSIHCKNCAEVKDKEIISSTGEHKYGEIEIIKEATAVKKGTGRKTCTVCGNIENVVIDKLPATAKLNMKTITLKVKQSTKALKVTGLAKGDRIKSYTSNNKKVAVVDKNGKITAKSVGKAKITVKLASGKKVTVTVKVQKTTVKTTSLTIKSKAVTVKKGETYTLKPVIKPLTSQQKITYQSSDNKVASISSKGKITARKKGIAIITIKSGTKVIKVKVTVK